MMNSNSRFRYLNQPHDEDGLDAAAMRRQHLLLESANRQHAPESGWMVLETFSVSHGKASAYLPVIDLLRNYFDISPEDDERKRREKVAGRLSMLDPSLEDTRP